MFTPPFTRPIQQKNGPRLPPLKDLLLNPPIHLPAPAIAAVFHPGAAQLPHLTPSVGQLQYPHDTTHSSQLPSYQPHSEKELHPCTGSDVPKTSGDAKDKTGAMQASIDLLACRVQRHDRAVDNLVYGAYWSRGEVKRWAYDNSKLAKQVEAMQEDIDELRRTMRGLEEVLVELRTRVEAGVARLTATGAGCASNSHCLEEFNVTHVGLQPPPQPYNPHYNPQWRTHADSVDLVDAVAVHLGAPPHQLSPIATQLNGSGGQCLETTFAPTIDSQPYDTLKIL